MEMLLRATLRLIFWLKGYKFYEVESSEEEKEVIEFACKILSEEGYDQVYLKLLERYYPNSVLFVARQKGKLVGTARLLDPYKECRILDFWNLDFPEDVKLAELRELGMMAVDQNYRGKSRLPITGLIEIAYQYSVRNGIKWWMSSATEKKFQKFKTMNPSCRLLSELEPTEHQLKFRKDYSQFYESFKSITLLFVFDLKDASYSRQFKRILKRKMRLGKTS